MENVKRNIYASALWIEVVFIVGQRGPSGAQVTTVNRQWKGARGGGVGVRETLLGHSHVKPDVHTCDRGSPISGWLMLLLKVTEKKQRKKFNF